ncbi:MAG: ABC transporter permease, partial [Oscillospiraceae bacterium]|nr:ABC transporter permease [Oscillospiraceae bacterium]
SAASAPRQHPLRKKLLRDLKGNAMQIIAMILLCFLGTWVFAGLDGSWRLMDYNIETYFETSNLADFWVNAAGFSRQDLTEIRHIGGVKAILPRTSVTVDVEGLGEDVEAALEIYEGPMDINRPYLRSGALLQEGDTRGCLMEEQFAAAHGLQPGDSVTLLVAGQRLRFTVRGTILSAEYTVTSKETVPDPDHYGFILLNHCAIPDLPYTTVLVKLEEGADESAVQAAIEKVVPTALVVTTRTHGNVSTARGYAKMFHGLAYVFPVLAFSVAAMIVVSTLKRMIDKQRMEIGTLKELGYTNRRIRRHYLWYSLLPSIIGSVIGLFVGWYTIPKVIWEMMVHNSRYPYMMWPPISPIAYGMTGLSVALSVLICQIALRSSMRESPAELLRPKPPKGGTRVLLERWTGLWKRLSFNSKMIIRNLMRHKGRTVILLAGIICCNMLIIATFGLQDSIEYFMRQYYGGTLTYDIRVDLKADQAGTLESYRSRLDAECTEGIMEIGVSLHGARKARACLLTVMEDDQTIWHLTADQQILQMPEENIVISRKLATIMGISLGDPVEIYLPGDSEPIRLTAEEYADVNVGQGILMGKAAWEKCRKGPFSVTALLLREPSELTMHHIEESEDTEAVKTLETQFSEGMTILDATATAFSIMSGAALGLSFVICYNMGLMNFTERIRDYATLKVLGYHQREIRSLMLRESSLPALLGTLLGIPPGIALVSIILRTCEFDSMVFVGHVTPLAVLLASVITFAFAVCVEWLLTRKVRGIDMVEALKSVE